MNNTPVPAPEREPERIQRFTAEVFRLLEFSDRFKKIAFPKNISELHVHMGSAMSLRTLWHMATERGFRDIGRYKDFIRKFRFTTDSISDLTAYTGFDIQSKTESVIGKGRKLPRRAFEVAERLQSSPEAMEKCVFHIVGEAVNFWGNFRAAEGFSRTGAYEVNRIELRFNPLKRTLPFKGSDGKPDGLYDVEEIFGAAVRGAEKAEETWHSASLVSPLKVGFICCLGREFSQDQNRIVAEKVANWNRRKPDRILGLDLAGPEGMHPYSDEKAIRALQEFYEIAGPSVGRTIHLGEDPKTTLDTFIATIEAVKPARIGHPIVAYTAWRDHGDDRGLKLMAERGIVAEVCPFSNILTRAHPTIQSFIQMLNTFDRFDVKYSISTDGPGFHGFTHADELFHLFVHGLSEEQIVKSLQVGNEASFLPK